METKRFLEEKLCTELGEDLDLFLEQIQIYEFEGDAPPYFDIIKPGRYVLEGIEKVRPCFYKIKKEWARLSNKQREAFIAGLEAANMPAAKQSEDDCLPF